MNSIGYALARAGLIRALTAYSGITTADGAVDGTTLVDSNLIGRNDFISEKTILIVSGDAKDEDKGATSFDNGTGTITLQGTGFSAQIKAGTIYRVLNISTVEIDVANINTKIGTNTDPAGTTTLFAWLAKLFSQGGQGLVYYGKVTQVDDVTHFRVAGLTGFGDAYFANNYRVYVVRDAAGLGAAPQGEMQPCSGYTSTNAIFSHTAFSVSLAVDDEILLLHERVAEVADLISRLGDPSAHTLTSLVAKWGDIARSLDLILGSRWDAAGDLGTDIAAILGDIGDASASTLGSLYAILGNPAQSFLTMIGYEGAIALADKLTAARAGYLDELNTIKGATGIFHEQADVAVNITAINTAETDVFHLSAVSTRYIVRSLRLKCADPGVNTVTVRLYELVNDVLTEVDSFDIDSSNFGTYHSLMDMFGLPHLAGDELQVTVRASAGGPYAVTGQYSHAKTNV